MSDMRKAVARAIDQEIPSIVPWGNKVIERCADAAIAAATPIIERELIRRISRRLHEQADQMHRSGDHAAGSAVRQLAQGLMQEADHE